MTRSVPTGSRIRDRRLALGRRQAAVAVEAGISPSYLNLIEHNRRAIGGALLTRLATLLDIDRTALSAEDDAPLVAAVTQAGAARGMGAAALAQAGELARRHPDWGRLVAAQAAALEAQAAALDAMSDRLARDPVLADAMHELLSTVSTVRATASILAQTPQIDRNWLGRFHANLDEDSRRLAEAAEAVVALLDGQATRGGERVLPMEAVARFLDAHGHRFEALEAVAADGSEGDGGGVAAAADGRSGRMASGDAEDRPDASPETGTDGRSANGVEGHGASETAAAGEADGVGVHGASLEAVIADLVAEVADPAARRLAGEVLRGDAADAARLPAGIVRAARGPEDLAGVAGGDLALVLRRMGVVDAARGLAICDGAGAMVRRVSVAGFPWPQAGAGCALWPLYGSLTQPGRGLVAVLEMPDGALWRAHAVAAPIATGDFDAAPVLRATMLVTRADGEGARGRVVPVGPGCRTCPRDGCAARREPSVLSGGA